MGEPTVYLYGNHACPFTYLADRRLRLLAGERPLRVVWRPLALHPGTRADLAAGISESGSGEDPAHDGADSREEGAAPDEAVGRALQEAAAELGLPLRWPLTSTDSRPALQAAEFARDLGEDVFSRLHAALFRARFAEGADLGDREALLAIAEAAGADPAGLAHALEDGRYEEELERAREEAARYRITGTPAMLFGRFLLLGAAPLSEMRRAAAKAAGESADGPLP